MGPTLLFVAIEKQKDGREYKQDTSVWNVERQCARSIASAFTIHTKTLESAAARIVHKI